MGNLKAKELTSIIRYTLREPLGESSGEAHRHSLCWFDLVIC
jgi:hypothetical protein